MKNVLVCSDSFKGTLTSLDIISIAKEVIENDFKDIYKGYYLPLADGGEGSLDVISSLTDGEMINIETIDAEGSSIKVPYFISKDNQAYIEIAKIVGLPNIKNKIPRLERTSKGIGIVIEDALKRKVSSINIFLGGSSINEMGVGLLQYLGVDFNIKEPLNAKSIKDIYSFDAVKLKEKIKGVQFNCFSDVTNPLLGINGATYTFGKQKGYSLEELDYLEKELTHAAKLIKEKTNIDISNIRGTGAAGGLGACFYYFFNAKINSGIEEILKLSNFESLAKKADLIITGEGCFDSQSRNGKAIDGILKHASKEKIAIICGISKLDDPSIKIYETSSKDMSFEYIKKNAKTLYKETLIKVLNELR